MYFIVFLLIFNFSLFAQNKVALVIGDDCHELYRKTKLMGKLNAKSIEAFKQKDFEVVSLFGNEERSKEMSDKYIKDPSVKSESLSMASIKKNLGDIYSKPCAERPEDLMINFVAHGSYNKGNHTICTHADSKESKTKSIPVSNIANHIRSLKAKDPTCPKPRLAVMDFSCKSGGTISSFKGLGCALTSTSIYNSTKYTFVQDYIEKIKSSTEGSSLNDLHLDMLLDRDYSLAKYNSKKNLIEMAFEDSNQISGCFDENKGRLNVGLYGGGHYSKAPMCKSEIGILNETRDYEFKRVESIVGRLSIRNNTDQDKIAKRIEGDVPKASEIPKIIEKLLIQSKNMSKKIDAPLKEEASLFSKPSLNKAMKCPISVGDNIGFLPIEKIKNLRNSLAVQDEESRALKRSFVYSFCSEIDKMKIGLSYGACIKDGSTGSLGLTAAQLLLLQKKLNLQESASLNYKLNKGFKTKRAKKTGLDPYSLIDLFKESIDSCAKEQDTSEDPEIRAASIFVNKHYQTSASLNCDDDNLQCHLKNASNVEAKIKRLLGITRGYFFLKCQQQFDKSDELKDCEEFKI